MWCAVSVLFFITAFSIAQNDFDFADFEGDMPDMDLDLVNELLDQLLKEYTKKSEKTLKVHSPNAPILEKPLEMTAKTGVFERPRSFKRVSSAEVYDEQENAAKMNVSFTFGYFVAAYDGFVFHMKDFKTAGKIEVKVVENEILLGTDAGQEEECYVRSILIKFTKMKKFKFTYFSDKKDKMTCEKNLAVFNAFFSNVFVNAIRPPLEKVLLVYVNNFIKLAEHKACVEQPDL